MADPENPDTTTRSDEAPAEKSGSGGNGSGSIELTMGYIISIPGILKIVEFFTLMLAFALAADVDYLGTWGRMNFFLFVTITSWLLVIAVFVLFAFNIISKINLSIDWNIPVFVFALVAAILLLLSSALLADHVAGFSGSVIDKVRAAAAFGFISMFVFIADAVVCFLRKTGRM
ncbi:uncharacterized protein LOC111333498 [Stylophora pistillata]|uniref:MARVEL domain-containing protein n=1 Tax=Stylophora pistillata TaxID=50429 RepID=A0A2B4S0T2_STYPI|nr:uncharacterized protein LOC111333498 [Stylophora pistillata]PFX23026.1 hypothetical protein AWC38_SpisGene12461 [Stylophora pistillata]